MEQIAVQKLSPTKAYVVYQCDVEALICSHSEFTECSHHKHVLLGNANSH